MRQLSGLDAGFLYIESEQAPMHVGSLTLYQLPENARDFAGQIRKHIISRLHLAPIFYQRLALMPFDLGHPVWVESQELDLDYHIQHHNIGRGSRAGSDASLEKLVASLHETLLDRAQPLWQFHIIEGLSDQRIGFYAKVHHAALDGAAGVLLANALLDLSPTPRAIEAGASKDSKASNSPSRSKLIGALFSNTFAQYAKLARTLPSAVKRVADLAISKGLSGTIAATKELSQGLLAPKTPFNVSIEAARQFASCTVSLAEIKAIAATCDATVNDVVMALCSGALRSYLLHHKALPERSLIAAVPVSLRELGDQRMNNQVTMVPAALGTHGKTAALRLQAAKSAMGDVKVATSKFKDLIPTDYPSLGAPWLIGGVAQLIAKTKLADRMALPVNLVISNVPGPKVPLYLAGAKMIGYFPLSIVVHGMALNITVHSYNGNLDFGLIACAKAVPDLALLAQALKAEHHELKSYAASVLLGPGKKSKASASAKSEKSSNAPPIKSQGKSGALNSKPSSANKPAKAALTKAAVAKASVAKAAAKTTRTKKST